MAEKRLAPEQTMEVLQQVEVQLPQAQTLGEVCRGQGVSEASFYRWCAESGDLKGDQGRRMKELERENTRLKRAAAELKLSSQSARSPDSVC